MKLAIAIGIALAVCMVALWEPVKHLHKTLCDIEEVDE